MLISGLFVFFLGLVVIYLAYLFNRLVKFSNAAEANLGQIRVALKKRLDMVEQLLGAVRGYVRHERGVFEDLASMRAKVFKVDPGGLRDIDRESRSIVGGILAVAEAYPELKANETVKKLMDAIVSVEDEIARHRYTYNNIVQSLNTLVDAIPSNIVARSASIGKLDYLQFEEAVESRPSITGIA
jgi:LemA protein